MRRTVQQHRPAQPRPGQPRPGQHRRGRLVSSVLSLALALTTAGAMLSLDPAAAAPAPAARVKHASTDFALFAMGHGTKARGGQVPVGSRTTAYQVIGCTNLAGITKENHVADATLPGAGSAHDLTTTVLTRKRKGVVSSTTRTSVATVVLGEGSPLGSVELRGITGTARASHGPDGYHATFTSTLGSIVYTNSVGVEQEFPIPSPGQNLEIPGLAYISLGFDRSKSNATQARAAGYAINVHMLISDTKVDIGRAVAAVSGDVKHGLFHGNSSAVRAVAADGNVTVGAQPLSVMPCQGTHGQLKDKTLAGLDLDGGLVVKGLRASHVGDQTDRAAFGHTEGEVASIDLGGGQLVIDGIKGVARVKRTDHGVKRNIRGSTIGSITVNGEPQTFPPTDVLEIPGVARLERNVTTRTKIGISVVALRITLADGSGAVIDLGSARLYIRKKH
jgi:hypothetical protein